MSFAVKLFALIPLWCGLDLLVGKIFGQQYGLIGLWNLIFDVALPIGNTMGIPPLGVYIAIAMWAGASLVIILINLFAPRKRTV